MPPLTRVLTLLLITLVAASAQTESSLPANLDQENLVAWCIVPFDASKRGPDERAAMLKELGLTRSAYDWRKEHIPTFEQEIQAYQKEGIEFFAFWNEHPDAFALFSKYDLHPQVWKTAVSPNGDTQEERVAKAIELTTPIAKKTRELGCKFGLYNHGGWGGEPENLVAVCQGLRALGYDHVGIIYNWHHGHEHIDDWAEALALMQPYLHCLNLNGMNPNAEPKILPLAQGKHELEMLKVVVESGYDGPIGILDHQNELDTKQALQDNLNGLAWLKKELVKPGGGGPKPTPQAKPLTANSAPPSTRPSVAAGKLVEGDDAWRSPPITVECRARLSDAKGYNILVASDTKASMNHWELFSMNGDGTFTAYLPGARPDHVRSEAVITDNKWHTLGIQYEEDRVRLYVDGRQVAEEAIRRKPLTRVLPGDLALARLVEGHIGLRGELGEVSIRSGIHDDLVADTTKALPQERNAQIGYWVYSEVVSSSDKTVSPMKTFDRAPIEPEANPFWKAYVNRDREYDYYAKQALFYGKQKWEDLPEILPEFPGLDGAGTGHWGNQNDDETWKDGRVRDMDHGSMVSGVFKGGGLTIPRAVSLKLGDGYHAVFNEDTLRFEYAWNGKHVEWSDVRRGFMHGIPPGPSKKVDLESAPEAGSDASYLGLYRVGDEVYFAYEDAGQTRYRHAVVKDGKVVENVLTKIPGPGKPVWPERPRTTGELGKEQPYAIDTLTLPYDNPWNVLFFSAGVDFLAENRIAICNIHGDVWICDVSGEGLQQLTWKRFAGGLYQPLGLKVVDGVIHVMCRDALLALHDLNGDDEADFYECVSNVHETSKGGHDFITGLQRDNQGRWFFASGNQGICRVSPDGKNLDVLATGFRNPNGLGISPDGSVVLTSVQEGTWTPASAICDASLGGHYGAGGPKAGPRGYVPPMLYLPRGVDNSSGGQTYIESDRWGPVQGQWVHYSGGFAKAFLVLREVFPDGESQAAAIQIPGSFLSGVHRGRFSPYDGQLYVAGAQGWGNYGTQDGCLQRVRFTGGSYPYPIAFETRDNGILLTFAEQPSEALTDKDKWFAQQWNYLYGPGYGSAEYSVKQPETPGHDPLQIRSVHRVGDGRQLFLEIPQLQPVHQLHLHCANDPRLELFATLHQLGKPYTEFPGYEPIQKTSLGGEALTAVDDFSPAALMQACAACHHPTQKVVGPPFAEIRQRYANNPDGIVKWAMNPENKNPELPPMPSFNFLGEEKLRIIADYILAGDE